MQYALAVEACGSFRGAAEICHVAQPSLSAQVAGLEEALGVQLFERRPRGVLTTTAGAPLLLRFRALLLAADDLETLATTSRDPASHAIALGVLPTIAPYLLADAAPALHHAFPKLAVTWTEGTTETLVAAVEEGSLDAALVAAEADLGRLVQLPIAVDPFLLAVAKNDPLARGRGPVSLKVLEGRPVLVLADGHCLGDQAISACRRVGGTPAEFRATSLATLVGMVEAGSGITLLPSIAVALENRRDGLVLRPFKRPQPQRTLVLVHRSGAPRSELLGAMGRVLTAAVSRARA